MSAGALAERERLVMLAVLRLGAEEAYTVSIADGIGRGPGATAATTQAMVGERGDLLGATD